MRRDGDPTTWRLESFRHPSSRPRRGGGTGRTANSVGARAHGTSIRRSVFIKNLLTYTRIRVGTDQQHLDLQRSRCRAPRPPRARRGRRGSPSRVGCCAGRGGAAAGLEAAPRRPTPYTLCMPGGDPLATCTLPVGVVYLLTYLRAGWPAAPPGYGPAGRGGRAAAAFACALPLALR